MESPPSYADFPLDADEAACACKGCGEVLEEGKAYELAGLRWHINCFRCYTCSTLLDSGANLLLLGDGSLICNDCTYSCSSCGEKIEELAILTGDQEAFCKTCFKCRNCKRKIDNLRYARTSHGIFCMDCHDALMARRKRKTARTSAQRQKSPGNSALLDKSLPSLPPTAAPTNGGASGPLSPDLETPPSDTHSDAPTEAPRRLRPANGRRTESREDSSERPRLSRSTSRSNSRDAQSLLHDPVRSRPSSISQKGGVDGSVDGGFLVPLSFDPTPPLPSSSETSNHRPLDYFGSPRVAEHTSYQALESSPTSLVTAPHIAHQDKGRSHTAQATDPAQNRRGGSSQASASTGASPVLSADSTRREYAPSSREASKNHSLASEEKFKLQQVPTVKRSGGSARSSNSGPISTPSGLNSGLGIGHGLEKLGEVSQGGSLPVQDSETLTANSSSPGRLPQDQRARADPQAGSSRSAPPSTLGQQLQYPPKRGDSLTGSSVGQPTSTRKETSSTLSKTMDSPKSLQGKFAIPSTPTNAFERTNGVNLVSRLADSSRSRGRSDTSIYKQAEAPASSVNSSFTAPRAPPSIVESPRSRNEGLASPGAKPALPGSPRWSASGVDLTKDEDLSRFLGGEESSGHESFLRKVSNTVRHRRSDSDKGLRSSKEQKWPGSPNGATILGGYEISSPTSASPEHRDELSWVKNELRRERQKALERDEKIVELESSLRSQVNIKQVNTELQEKRSNMVDLDAQKELVVRELEILTEHIAAAKQSGDRLDLSKMRHAVMRDFAESLQKLKDSFAPQIEELVQKRNELIDKLSHLTQSRDKSFRDFEQLSIKNAQLADLNNQLVHQIQDLNNAQSSAQTDPSRTIPNGLGIYSHHGEKSQVSIESRELRAQMKELSMTGSSTTVHPEEAEPVSVMQGPQMVSIRKGQPKKFNWKKGGHNVAKGVTKGLKGAFSSTQASYNREMQFTETVPYGSTPPGNDQPISTPRHVASDPPPPNHKLFGGNQKNTVKGPQQPWKSPSGGSSPALPVGASISLFGYELEARAEYENTSIPFIVTRCIEEVESRGMDVEGIYRKAGGASQIQAIREGFEASPPHGSDISDPDLDIHAVSSALKQYLRRLPHPLVTCEVYDLLLETSSLPTAEGKLEAQTRAIRELPKVHRDVLEFLMLHVHRVIEREPENLMTSLNIAVVFAPTIMRPESLTREMTDTKAKNEAVQFLVENCEAIFAAQH